MRDITHRGLTFLVGKYGSVKIPAKDIEHLVVYSLEPDELNKKQIREDLLNLLTIPIEWLIDHTIRAKSLTIRCLWEAHQLYHEGDSEWIRFLGWAHHYITDWGTPPHSSTSNANPVPALAGLGAILGGFLGGITKSGESLETTLKGIAQGALMGIGILGGIGTLGLLAQHQDFEERCDQRWKENSAEIKRRFKNAMKKLPTNTSFVENLYSLEIMMDELKKKCDLLSSEWIHTSQNDEFIEYMVNIAIVINFATYIVIR